MVANGNDVHALFHCVFRSSVTYLASSAEVVLEPLESVTYERKCHFGCFLLVWLGIHGHRSLCLRFQVLCGEIRRIYLGLQARFKRRMDSPETIKIDTGKERMRLDLVSATPAKSIAAIADETIAVLVYVCHDSGYEIQTSL